MNATSSRTSYPLTSVLVAVALLASVLVGVTTVAVGGPADRIRLVVGLAGAPAIAEMAAGRAGGTGAADQRSLGRARHRAGQLRSEQDRLAGRAKNSGLDVRVVRHLTAAYNGMVVDVPRAQAATLRSLLGVQAVHADTTYELTLDDSVPLVGAPDVWKRTDPSGRTADGTGMTVAVLDSGIDYRHPDLGAGFGPGHKVVTGYDFVNEDADPMDDNGHGTHVAGIVAGNGRIRGVAPGAQLAAYKVTNKHGTAQLADILAALDVAVAPSNEHRADVVNMSLSGPGDGTDPLATAADQAVEAGVVVVASAGNSGPHSHTVGSPAAAERVLAVGASVSGITIPSLTMTVPARQNLRALRRVYSANAPTTPKVVDVVDVGRGNPADYEGKDVAGKAVLCGAYVPLKDEIKLAALAQEHGAVAFLTTLDDTWQSVPGGQVGTRAASVPGTGEHAFAPGEDDGRLEIVATFIPGASSATLRHHLAAGPVRVEIAAEDGTDQLADFSSRGPSGRFVAKPDVVAPGVDILSTLPGGSHGRLSGTSMSAPHVAGAVALVRQLHPSWSATQASSAVAGSAHRVLSGSLSQGGGRLDVPAAARAQVVASRHSLSFGLADLSRDRIEGTTSWALTNVGSTGVGVSMSVERSDELAASVRVEPSNGHLAAGNDLQAQLRVSLPTPRSDGDVVGWVNVDVGRDGSVDVRLPFLLSVRHLSVHATPDPAPEGTQSTIFVRSHVDLPVAPTLEVTCPGLSRQRPALQVYSTRIWRAVVRVDDDGVCRAQTSAVAPGLSGPVTVTGEVRFEVAEEPRDGGGPSSWQPVGPNARAGWLAFGTSSDRMAVIPIDAPSIFITEDRMRTWREIRSMPMAGGRPDAVQPDPRHGDGVYVAVNGRRGGDASYEGRMLHTSDGGRTWRILPGPDTEIITFAVDDGGGVLAVADNNGVRVSTDQGASWTQLPKAWTTLFDLHWIGSDLYLATDRGLQVIRDAANGGGSGVKDLFQPAPQGWASQVAGDAETIIVASYPSAWLYVSRDGGATFQQVLQKTGISFQDVELIGDDIFALQGSRDLWVGNDRGVTWTSWGDPLGKAVEFDVGRWPRPHPSVTDTVYVASAGAGLYAADRPGEFRRTGVPAAQVHDVAIVGTPGQQAVVAGTDYDSFRTTLPGDSIKPEDLEWQSAGGEGIARGVEARFLAVSPDDPRVIFKTGRGLLTFNIHRSDDGGATWQLKARPSEVPTSLLVHPADPRRVYVGYRSLTGSGLLESRDGGETWRKIHHGYDFRALAGDPANPDRIWAGHPTGLFRSDDGGLGFDRVAGVPVSAIAVDPADGDNLLVGGRQLFTSRDGGRTMRAASGATLPMWITDLAFDPVRRGHVFAAAGSFYDELGVLRTGRGVLHSENDGENWRSMSGGLDNTNVNGLAIDGDGRYLFAGTAGGSVHRIRLPR